METLLSIELILRVGQSGVQINDTGYRSPDPKKMSENYYLITDRKRYSICGVPAQFKRTSSGKIQYRGELFSGFNKPKTAPAGDPKKYVVLAKSGSDVRKLKFGQRGYKDFLQHKSEKRRANFKSRMNCSSEKNKLTPKWWACNYNW